MAPNCHCPGEAATPTHTIPAKAANGPHASRPFHRRRMVRKVDARAIQRRCGAV